MNEISIPEVDTTVGLWDRRFECRIKQLATTSDTYLRLFGTHTHGDKAIDREMANQLITTFLPIVDMAEYYKNNVTIHIAKRSDLPVIYDLVEAHLNAWKYHLGRGLNTRKAPIEDLMLLDKFANSIFGHTKYEMKDGDESSFIKYLRSVHILSKPIMLSVNNVVDNASDDLPVRNSFTDAFKTESFNNRSWRRGG